ncbi:YncE family protein [Albibacterium profundi]|uniref:ATP-binding protein n=1 Tax=Albibacterium profundi TaxID=3134906 RepID=A0ABV5CH14_9SPHI
MRNLISKTLATVAVAASSLFLLSSCGNSGQSNSAESTDSTATENLELSLSLEWKTDSTFTGSESALYYAPNNIIYLSCGNTDPSAKDGDGFIALLHPDGTVKNKDWVTGLDAPRGMAIMNDKLYVTDIDVVHVINIESAEIEQTIPVEGAVFLNDLATNGESIFFSDSRTGVIHALNEAGEVTAVVTGAEGINGLECYNGDLYSLDAEGLKRYDSDYTSMLINSEVTGGDGLVILGDSTFIASRWEGEIYYINGQETTLLLDTKGEESKTADIGFIEEMNMVLVPTFTKNELAAYRLE